MPAVEAVGDRIVIESQLREKELVKKVPGAKWNRKTEKWEAPLSWAAYCALHATFGSTLVVGEKLTTWVNGAIDNWIRPALDLRVQLEVPELMAVEPDLYPFQRVGAKFLSLVGRALITDDMGSGKSVQLARTLGILGDAAFPALVVCPNSMKFTWKAEIEKWIPGRTVSVVDGTAAVRRKALEAEADVYVINWEALRLHSRLAPFGSMSLSDKEKEPKELNRPWGAVIADEAHRMKDAKSKQTRAMWAIGQEALFKFAATGTPIESNPGELWPIMHFVAPNEYPKKTAYVDRYCLESYSPFGGTEIVGLRPENAQEFSNILSPRMIRRPKDVILPQLPPKTRSIRWLTMGTKQAKAYRDMAKEMVAVLDGGTVSALDGLQQYNRLSQFASALASVNEEGKVKLTGPSNKVEALLEDLEAAPNEQFVVFAQSRQLIELAADELQKKNIPFGLITGGVSPEVRQLAMEKFQAGELRVMFGTAAAAEGITLTSSRFIIFLQRFDSSIKSKQAEDRVHRIGQERPVEIIDYLTEGTVEQGLIQKAEGKEITAQEILRDDDIRRAVLAHGVKVRKAPKKKEVE